VTVTVDCRPSDGGWLCDVQVGLDGNTTRHAVRVAAADLARLAPGATDPTELVRRSFDFLLARESPRSILRSFELTDISRYFPEFEDTIAPGSHPG
jgi:hypothetical protein